MLIRGVRAALPLLEGNKFTKCSNISTFRQLSAKAEMTKKALVLLGSGSEELEFVAAADVLARGGVEVTVAGVPDSCLKKCSRGVHIQPDISIDDAKCKGAFDLIVLPGGVGGSNAFAESKAVGELLQQQEKEGRFIAAICAAPTALKAHGIGIGKNVTSYPSKRAQMEEGGKYKYLEDNVVVDGNLITSRGPGTAVDFALVLLDKLMGKEKATEVAKGMLLTY